MNEVKDDMKCEMNDNMKWGTKGDWDLRISDLVKNPDGIDI